MKNLTEDKKPSLVRRLIIGVVVLLLLLLNYFYFRDKTSSNAELINHFTLKADPMEKYRNPAVAGLFYASQAQELAQEVNHYLNTDYHRHQQLPKILIVPHAGYQYSAPAAAQAYRPLQDFSGQVKTVILLGPSHRVALKGAALPTDDYFSTPLGEVKINHAIIKELQINKSFELNNIAHKDEHSLEVQLPFLQKVLTDFTIVPIVYGDINPQEIAEALMPILQQDGVLLVVSADLSHYLKYEDAQTVDQKTAAKIEQQSAEIEYHQSCGAGGINTALVVSQLMHLKPEVLSLINSGDTSGIKEKVVGYGAWSFCAAGLELEQEAASLQNFALTYKPQLLKVARTSLEEAVLHQNRYQPDRKDFAEDVYDKGAAFVTLKQNGELRGCIGSLLPNRAVILDIADNTYNAALSDSRFNPLTAEELSQITLSLSLLTGYEKIDYTSEEDLLSQLKPGVDGLVIRDGDRQGLFLPSVWEQLPNAKDFLTNLKLKAGMSPSHWSNTIKAYRFRTVEIKENEN